MTLHPMEQITGGEPDPLANSIGGREVVMLVGIGSIEVLGRGHAREEVNSTAIRMVVWQGGGIGLAKKSFSQTKFVQFVIDFWR